ncbi:DUF1028 domain-containing protein [Oceanibaculum pacificum]|uniref:DUF1028 domain-containing protein n=1 Tax=Oceanibaculum pacificum TaxID=580166 RepID=UPI0009FCB849|nr:DUF1028 domain-containing protein [Oceanibaculum pacificum]
MTFSLIGRCARTGQFGAVISTSATAVGSRCVYLKSGKGGFLTQHRTDPRLGPRGVRLLEEGLSARDAMAAVVASTPDIGWRQLACIDDDGGTAFHHGDKIYSIHAESQARDCVAIGNIIDNPDVPKAMTAAFTADPSLDIAERLLRAIEAGEAAGGETGTVHSAQLVAVGENDFVMYDLRIDWSETPIPDLRLLWERYKPEVADFAVRVLEPDAAPMMQMLFDEAKRRMKELGLEH